MICGFETVAHVTSNAGKFLNLISYKGRGIIVLGNGSHHSTYTGNVSVILPNSSLPLFDVLLTLAIKKNIIFVLNLLMIMIVK